MGLEIILLLNAHPSDTSIKLVLTPVARLFNPLRRSHGLFQTWTAEQSCSVEGSCQQVFSWKLKTHSWFSHEAHKVQDGRLRIWAVPTFYFYL